jgi:hypothetical protein
LSSESSAEEPKNGGISEDGGQEGHHTPQDCLHLQKKQKNMKKTDQIRKKDYFRRFEYFLLISQ